MGKLYAIVLLITNLMNRYPITPNWVKTVVAAIMKYTRILLANSKRFRELFNLLIASLSKALLRFVCEQKFLVPSSDPPPFPLRSRVCELKIFFFQTHQ